MKAFSARILAFIEEYLLDLNATQAAIRAGYSKSNAHNQGSRLLENAKVAAAIAERMKARAERCEIDQDKVLREIYRLAMSDARKVMTWGPTGVKLIDSAELSDDDAAMVAEVSQTITKEGGSIRLKMHDKPGSLQMLGRHLGLFVDKVEHTGKDGGPIETRNVGDLTDQELFDIATSGSTGTADPKARTH